MRTWQAAWSEFSAPNPVAAAFTERLPSGATEDRIDVLYGAAVGPRGGLGGKVVATPYFTALPLTDEAGMDRTRE
ncbi:hypothetical protein Scel_25340 [Streptomyces cellostaticus]|nr:hypothetical protein Scel_25340 [Streptomyces cellostaticus]